MILIHMLTGVIPYSDLKKFERYPRITSGEPPKYELPNGTSDDLAKFIQLLHTIDSKQRPSATEALEDTVFITFRHAIDVFRSRQDYFLRTGSLISNDSLPLSWLSRASVESTMIDTDISRPGGNEFQMENVPGAAAEAGGEAHMHSFEASTLGLQTLMQDTQAQSPGSHIPLHDGLGANLVPDPVNDTSIEAHENLLVQIRTTQVMNSDIAD